MIGYSCRYAPVELLLALGGTPVLLDGEEPDFELAERLTHANLCCHAKALIQQGGRSEELLLTNCCDSMRRTYDVLKEAGGPDFLYLMDLPHDDGACARDRLKRALLRLAKTYEEHTGVAFDRAVFLKVCRESVHPLPREPFLAVLGARVSPPLMELIQSQFPLPVVNLTCSGGRDLELPPEGAEEMSFEKLMDWYAGALLRTIPCMRMSNVAGRRALTDHPQLKGVVYNTVKFCDFYGFDYAALKDQTDAPILKIESDYMPQPSGQLTTRLEAFAESLGLQAGQERIAMEKSSAHAAGLYAGIDSGSTTTNMVVINEKHGIISLERNVRRK